MHPNSHDAERRAAHLCAPCRAYPFVEARQVAMYLMRTWLTLARGAAFPMARIGRLLGGRDHSTVMHGTAVIATRLDSGRQEDAYLHHMICSIGTTLDATYEVEEARHRRAA